MRPGNIGQAAKAAGVLCLFLSVAMAVQVTLPATPVKLSDWYGDAMSGKNYYDLGIHVFYRVLISSDGTERVLDAYKWDNHVRPIEHEVPALTIDVPNQGDYRVELRHIVISAPTNEKFPNASYNSVVDVYGGEVVPSYYTAVIRSYRPYSYTDEARNYCTVTSPDEYKATGLRGSITEIIWDKTVKERGWTCPWGPTSCGYDYSMETVVTGTQDCASIGQYPVLPYCKFSYGDSYTSASFDRSASYCWVERRTNASVSLSSLAKVERSEKIHVNEPPRLALTDISALPGDKVTLNIAASDPGDSLTYYVSSPVFYSGISLGDRDVSLPAGGQASLRLPKGYFVLNSSAVIVPTAPSFNPGISVTVAGSQVWSSPGTLGFDEAAALAGTGQLYDSSLSYDNFYLGRYDKAKWDRWYYGGLSKPFSADIIRLRTSGSGLFGISDGTKSVYVASVGSAQTDVTIFILNNMARVYYNGVYTNQYDLSILNGQRRLDLYSLSTVYSVYFDNLSNYAIPSYPVSLDAAAINSFLGSCAADASGYCDVPLIMRSASPVSFALNNIIFNGYPVSRSSGVNAKYYYGAPFDASGSWVAEPGEYTFDVIVNDQYGAFDIGQFRLSVGAAALTGADTGPGYSAPDSSFASGSADSPFNPSKGTGDNGSAPSLPSAALPLTALAVASAAGLGFAYYRRSDWFGSGNLSQSIELPVVDNRPKKVDEDARLRALFAEENAIRKRLGLPPWVPPEPVVEEPAPAVTLGAKSAGTVALKSNIQQPLTKAEISAQAYQAALKLKSGQKDTITIGGVFIDIAKDKKGNVSVTPHWTTAPATLTPVQQQMADDAKARADRTAAMYKNTATIAKQDQMNVELLIAKYGIVGTLENIEDGKVAIPDRQVGMLKDRLYAIKGSDLEGEAFWQAELLMHRAASGDAEAKAKVTALSMVTSQDFLGLGSGFARLTGDEQRAYEIKRDAITAYFRERLVNENPTLGYITGAPVVQLAAAAGLGFGANAAVTVGMRVAPMATSTAVAGATGLYTYNVGATAVEYIQEGDYAGLGAFIMTEGLNLGAFMYGAGVGAKAITEMTTNTVTKPNFIVKPLQDAKLAGEHFAKVRPTIETAAKLSKINPNIEVIYTEMSGWAAASRDSLFLDVLKPAKELINRITIEHEVSGHMKAFQTRFKTEADFQRYESKVKAMRKGANSWLDENEANSMIKVIHGDEIFKQRVDSLVGEIKEIYSWKDRYPVIYLEAIRKPDFIEQLASIENLENLAGISKDITGNVRKDLIVNRFVSTEDYNKIINVMSENTNNILNGRIVPENAIMEQHEIIAKIIYGG